MAGGRRAANAEQTVARPRSRAKGSAAPSRSGGRAASEGRARDGHRGDLVALALIGVSLFLFFALVAASQGGVLGEWANAGLRSVLGRVAVILPLGLLAVGVLLIFERPLPWRSPWFLGGTVALLSLLLLVAAGFPPLGPGHPPETFAASLYQGRAGAVGEGLYAGIHALAGSIGVGLAGWLGLVAGLILLTGLTLRRTVEETGRAATTVKAQAEERTRRLRERGAGWSDDPGPLDPYLSGFGPATGSRGSDDPFADWEDEDWSYEGEALEEAADDDLAEAPTLEGEGDLWFQATGRRAGERILYPVPDPPAARPPELVDGAAAFPDLYDDEGGREPEERADGGEDQAEAEPVTQPPAAIPRGGEGHDVPDETAEDAADAADVEDEPSDGDRPHLREVPAPPEEPPRYVLPDPRFLKKSGAAATRTTGDEETADLLIETLSHFGVDARVVATVVGPRVTRYELQLAPGTKVSKISNLKDDLAYALASTEIRILAPIPGKQAVGVEVPNRRPSFVTLGDIYRDFPRGAGPLMVWLGKDISGKPVYADLTKMPHLLIAGTTGSGKSGCVNCIISSILLRSTPAEVRMILIDPKKVELSHYERIPHLLVPVVTNMKNAAGVLANVVKEMENRYELMELEKSRHLDEMNKNRRRRGEDPLPYLLVVVDELADLMMVSPAEVEEYIIRLAQKARAVGIHLVVATQRPSADVITGLIKANIPSRIAFAVSSQIDSRVILDVNGAESLLGMGDMLFRPLGSSRLQRVQGAFITETEIGALVRHVRGQQEPEFREELLLPPEPEETDADEFDPDEDELLADAAELVLDTGTASVSMLQRRLRVGYTRAGRLIDMLERRGIVGPHEGSKARQILVSQDQREEIIASLRVGDGPVQEPLDFPLDDPD